MRAPPLALAFVLALAACGDDTPAPVPDVPPPGSPAAQARAECQQQAYDDPTVKEIMRRRSSSNDVLWRYGLADENDAVADATQRCLAQRGLAPRGGVERVKQAR